MGRELGTRTRTPIRLNGRLGLAILALAAVLVLLPACGEMQDQPSYRLQEPPRLSAPAASVPLTGLPKTYTQEQAVALSNPIGQQPGAAEAGKELYDANCNTCHGADGKGTGAIAQYFPPQPTDLTSAALQGRRDGEIFWAISNGFGRMPAFQKRLSEEERWQIVQYVRQLQSQ